MLGETIKGFKITSRLGRGGMGDVWLAEQQLIKTRVAIKLLRADVSTDQQHVQRFFNEAIAVGKISHTGVVKIFDVGVHAGRAFLMMEFLEGETLSSRIARVGRLPAGTAAEFGRQIASILEATHAKNIIHRDLKPDNVFLVPDAELECKERVKILDFGIAKLGTGLTATGDRMGTPTYMPPEQWDNAANADARADVYSFGCLVFEMCCGRPSFEGASFGEAYRKHVQETPPRPSSLVPELAGELDDLIVRMLAKAPTQRPAVREIGTALAPIAAKQPRTLDTTVPPPPTPALDQETLPLVSSPMLELAHRREDLTVPMLAQAPAERPVVRDGDAASAQVATSAPPEPEAQSTTKSLETRRRGDDFVLEYLLGQKDKRWRLLAAIGAGTGLALGAIAMYVATRGQLPSSTDLESASSLTGLVKIESRPTGGEIYFDGTHLTDRAPLTVDGIPVGTRHAIRVEMPGRKVYNQTIDIPKTGGQISVLALMEPSTGKIIANSQPDGAEIWLDDQLRGRTPMTLGDLDMETARKLELRLEGYNPTVIDLDWSEVTEIMVNPVLQR